MNDLPPNFIGVLVEARLRGKHWRTIVEDFSDSDLDRLAAIVIAATI